MYKTASIGTKSAEIQLAIVIAVSNKSRLIITLLELAMRTKERSEKMPDTSDMSQDELDLWSDINNPNNDVDMDDWADAHNPNNDDYLGED